MAVNNDSLDVSTPSFVGWRDVILAIGGISILVYTDPLIRTEGGHVNRLPPFHISSPISSPFSFLLALDGKHIPHSFYSIKLLAWFDSVLISPLLSQSHTWSYPLLARGLLSPSGVNIPLSSLPRALSRNPLLYLPL